jgi:hypothetical protein
VSNRRWTDEEAAILEREYPTRKNSEIGKMIGRSGQSVRTKAKEMGLKKPVDFLYQTRLKKDESELKTSIRIRSLGKNELVPPMPCCLLWHLREMEGCMDTAIVLPNRTQREYQDRLHAAKPKIKEMLHKKMSGTEIAKAMGMRYSTVYGYIKEIKAAA